MECERKFIPGPGSARYGARAGRRGQRQQEFTMPPQIIFQLQLVLGYAAWLLCFRA
jgi:hypothetical protein